MFALRNDNYKITKLGSKGKTIAGIFRDKEMEASEVASSLFPWHKSNLE